jgi:probable HAF family extracellular repeat protein
MSLYYVVLNNDLNIIAGTSDTASGGSHAALWAVSSKGTVSFLDLGTLGGTSSQAEAINDLLEVVGSSDTATGTDAFLWIGKMFDLGNLGGSFAVANSINNLSVVVGSSNTAGDTDVHAFIWTAKKGLVDLNKLIPANSGWDLQVASSINDSGTIVGAGLFNGASHAFILSPQ